MSIAREKLYWIHIWKLCGLIVSDRTLPPVCKTIGWLLLNHYNLKTGKCFPSHHLLKEESNYKLRQVKNATKRLNKKYIPIAKKGKTGLANEYQPAFELVANDPDVVQFCAIISAKTQSKKGYKSAPQTINQTIYKTKEDEERELLGKVSFVKKGIHLQSISQVDLEEMYHRQLITEEEYKKW